MNYNRRDHKNRRLKEGESQRADKRYRFTYVDLDGNKRDVYSWRLDKNDPHPEGKRKDLSLREKEKQIERDRYDQILSNGGNYDHERNSDSRIDKAIQNNEEFSLKVINIADTDYDEIDALEAALIGYYESVYTDKMKWKKDGYNANRGQNCAGERARTENLI